MDATGASAGCLILIPARMGSSRFFGKPLVELLGVPMVGHVALRAMRSGRGRVAVATCDHEIREYAESIGVHAVMTGDRHERASDRCAEALLVLEAEWGARFSEIVMVQGDEPMLHPAMIGQSLAPMEADPSVRVTNLLGEFEDNDEMLGPSCIKVVCDIKGDAMYMTRQQIPTGGALGTHVTGKQVCVIGFRRDDLVGYSNLSSTPLEQAESIDMLRFMEHGVSVRMAQTEFRTHAVDTPADVEVVERALHEDPLTREIFG